MRTEADREEERRRDAWSQSAAMLSTELPRGSCCWTTSSADACGVRAQDALRAAKLGKERAAAPRARTWAAPACALDELAGAPRAWRHRCHRRRNRIRTRRRRRTSRDARPRQSRHDRRIHPRRCARRSGRRLRRALAAPRARTQRCCCCTRWRRRDRHGDYGVACRILDHREESPARRAATRLPCGPGRVRHQSNPPLGKASALADGRSGMGWWPWRRSAGAWPCRPPTALPLPPEPQTALPLPPEPCPPQLSSASPLPR